MTISRYTQGMWELKSAVVLSNVQPYEEGLLLYLRAFFHTWEYVRESFKYTQGYVKES